MPTTLQRVALIGAGLVIAASLSGCGDAPGAPSSSPQAAPVPPVTPSLVPASAGVPSTAGAAQSVALDSVGWLAGFKVAVSSASVDPATSVVSVEVLLTNPSQVDESFSVVGGEVSLTPGDDGVITLPLKTWGSHRSTPNELLCVPIPTGLPGRYVLKITDYYRKTATARIDVP